jgi:DnaJ-class molecular chaperone
MAKRIEFGTVVPCPLCKGRGSRKKNKVEMKCPQCDGTGVIPNKGPIA